MTSHVQLPLDSKNSKLFADLVLAIEKEIDVNAIAIDGVELWPIIRARLRKPFKVVEENPHSTEAPSVCGETQSSMPPKAKQPASSAPSPLWRIAERALHRLIGSRSLRAPVPVPRKTERLIETQAPVPRKTKRPIETQADVAARVQAEIDKLDALGPLDFVIFARPNKYYQTLGGKRYAPILDPVFEDLRERGNTAVLCEGRHDFECVNAPHVFETSDHMSLRRFRPRPEFPAAVRQIAEIQQFLASTAPQFEVDPAKVIFRFNSHNHKREFYRAVFTKLRPKVVFFSSFTSWVPVIWACRTLGIPTVDIQHGGQSSHHGFNTHYGNVPRCGYSMLPDFFWCWGYQNQEIINRWFPGGANRHVPLVGGNRWKAKWEHGKGMHLLSEQERDFVRELDKHRAVVLVTLSHGVPVAELLSPALCEAIRTTPECHWAIRLHPINRTPDVIAELKSIMEREALHNTELDCSTTAPLHVLLQYADCHITPFSTAAREAADFGVPTTIIDPIGRMDFAEDIDTGLFGYADTSADIVGAVRKALTTSTDDTTSLLETDDELVDALLLRVLSSPREGTPANDPRE